MSDEIKDFETVTPTLTFDPFEEVKEPMPETVKEMAVEDAAFNENTLTPEERQMVENFSQQIELTNSNMIMQYGAGAQKKIADFSETALDSVKSKDLGEIGNMLTNMVTELKSFDVQEEEKGFFGFFKKSANKITAMRAKYATAETNVNKISEILEGHQIQLMKDVAMLDKMYEVNKTYFKELSMYILAGKKKLAKTQSEELPALVEKSKASGLPEDAQAANDLAAMCNLMAEKIQSSLVNTIPLWKSQMVLALGVVHSGQAAEAQRQVTDMTNELLKKNADTLKMATIETAKESERGIVDIETLKHTNESLISTFDEVLRIQAEGREKRQAAEVEMQKIESELKQKLLEIKK